MNKLNSNKIKKKIYKLFKIKIKYNNKITNLKIIKLNKQFQISQAKISQNKVNKKEKRKKKRKRKLNLTQQPIKSKSLIKIRIKSKFNNKTNKKSNKLIKSKKFNQNLKLKRKNSKNLPNQINPQINKN